MMREHLPGSVIVEVDASTLGVVNATFVDSPTSKVHREQLPHCTPIMRRKRSLRRHSNQ